MILSALVHVIFKVSWCVALSLACTHTLGKYFDAVLMLEMFFVCWKDMRHIEVNTKRVSCHCNPVLNHEGKYFIFAILIRILNTWI